LTEPSPLDVFMSLIAMGWIFFILWRIGKNGKNLPKSMGALIRSLILIQCVMIAVSMDRNPVYRSYYLMTIILLLMFFLASGLAAKKFYGS